MNKTILFLLSALFVACFGKKKEEVKINTLEEACVVYGDMTYDDLTKREFDGQWVTPKVLTFDLTKIAGTKPIPMIDSVLFIPLETTDDCLIGDIEKIIFKNNLLYVRNEDNDDLFIFDADGRFKLKVGTEGRGPDEYGDMTDFAVGDNGDVFLLDNTNRKVLIFNPEGVFKKYIALENYYLCMQIRQGCLVLTLKDGQNPEGKDCRVEIVDTLGKMHKYYFPFDAQRESRLYSFAQLGYKTSDSDDFLYFPSYGAQAYLVGFNGKLKKSYFFNLPDKIVPPWLAIGSKIEHLGSAGLDKIVKEYSTLFNVFDLGDYIFAEMEPYRILYNKKKDFCELLYRRRPNAKQWPAAAFYGTYIVGAAEGNVLIGYATMSELKESQDTYHYDFGHYKQQISERSEDDNPMITLVKIKSL